MVINSTYCGSSDIDGIGHCAWTVRNCTIFGTLVIISTNGGDVFYRANNPLATGGFTPIGEKDLKVYKGDELLWNRMGYTGGCSESEKTR